MYSMESKKTRLNKHGMKTDILKTPLTDIWIEDENKNRIPFEIVPNTCNDHTVCLNNDINQRIEVTNYKDCRIRLETKDFEIRKNYYIRSSRYLEYRDSDEWLFTYGVSTEDKTLAISFPQPNDEYMMQKMFSHKEINEDDMEGYHLYVDGYRSEIVLRVLDYNYKYIYFPIAWIWDIQGNMDDYESAAACMTWDGLGWEDIFGQKS